MSFEHLNCIFFFTCLACVATIFVAAKQGLKDLLKLACEQAFWKTLWKTLGASHLVAGAWRRPSALRKSPESLYAGYA